MKCDAEREIRLDRKWNIFRKALQGIAIHEPRQSSSALELLQNPAGAVIQRVSKENTRNYCQNVAADGLSSTV
jgi:hypothetical protein